MSASMDGVRTRKIGMFRNGTLRAEAQVKEEVNKSGKVPYMTWMP